MNDGLKIRLVSGNGIRNRGVAGRGSDDSQEHRRNLKYAMFCLVVAALLLLTNQSAEKSPAAGDNFHFLANLRMDLSVAGESDRKRGLSESAEARTYVVHFRLANEGNQPVFYPVYPGTNQPIGYIVDRISPRSDWRRLSEAGLLLSTPDQRRVAGRTWVEMPPGGWVDGTYEDPGVPIGDHAYELDVKVEGDGEASPFFSQAYSVNAN